MHIAKGIECLAWSYIGMSARSSFNNSVALLQCIKKSGNILTGICHFLSLTVWPICDAWSTKCALWSYWLVNHSCCTGHSGSAKWGNVQSEYKTSHITLKTSWYPVGSWKPDNPLFIWSLYPSPIFCNTFPSIFLFTKSIWGDMQNHKTSQILYSNVWENWQKNTPIFRPLNACCFASRTDRDLILFLFSFWKCQDSKKSICEKSKMI